MLLRLLRGVTLTLAALATGVSFCHVLEMPAKMRYRPDLYAAVNSSLYGAFAPAGAVTMIGGMVGAAALAVLLRRRRDRWGFAWTAPAAVLLAGSLAAWALLVYPVNASIVAAWESVHPQGVASLPVEQMQSPPPEVIELWQKRRPRWESGHATVFAIQLLGFVTLLASVLRETPADRDAGGPEGRRAHDGG